MLALTSGVGFPPIFRIKSSSLDSLNSYSACRFRSRGRIWTLIGNVSVSTSKSEYVRWLRNFLLCISLSSDFRERELVSSIESCELCSAGIDETRGVLDFKFLRRRLHGYEFGFFVIDFQHDKFCDVDHIFQYNIFTYSTADGIVVDFAVALADQKNVSGNTRLDEHGKSHSDKTGNSYLCDRLQNPEIESTLGQNSLNMCENSLIMHDLINYARPKI